jgi:hypothetical protein
MVSRHSATLRESAEFPTSVKDVLAMFDQPAGDPAPAAPHLCRDGGAEGHFAAGPAATTHMATTSLTSVRTDADRMQRREDLAAPTIVCALIVNRSALVRWPEQWPHRVGSGHTCQMLHGSVTHKT